MSDPTDNPGISATPADGNSNTSSVKKKSIGKTKKVVIGKSTGNRRFDGPVKKITLRNKMRLDRNKKNKRVPG